MNGTIKGEDLRLHFNRHGAAPLVWCLSTPTFEIALKGFRTFVPLETVYTPKATPDDEDGLPSAWLRPMQTSRVYIVKIENGWAQITFGDVQEAT